MYWINEILEEFDREEQRLTDLAQASEHALRSLIEKQFKGALVSSRLKDRAELAKKVRKKGYYRLADVTDLCGIRVIALFADHVDAIGTLIESVFDIDRERSVDKRKTIDPDRFGYLSLHYIGSPKQEFLPDGRGLVCEIQVRSLLQHAWAEIEHDLGYKPGTPVPDPIRRRFSRLAGTLEMADDEFVAIRNDQANYALSLSGVMTERPHELGIDALSVEAFAANNAVVEDLDGQIAVGTKTLMNEEPDFANLAAMLRDVGISTIKQLQVALEKYGPKVVCAAMEWITDDAGPDGREDYKALSILYLPIIIAADRDGANGALTILNRFELFPQRARGEAATAIAAAICVPI
jgi:ppGpp synthetase/RelA/SpoT-type nucleotidyltranferase